MCICMCYTTHNTKTSGLNRCIRVYVHDIGLTRQRHEGYIGYVCVFVHVIGLTTQTDVGYIGCVCVYVHVIVLTNKEMRVT